MHCKLQNMELKKCTEGLWKKNMQFRQHQVIKRKCLLINLKTYSAQFIYNREDSQGASLMSYISSKEAISISPLNVSIKSDTSITNLSVKADDIPRISTKDG